MESIELKEELSYYFKTKAPCFWINTMEEGRAKSLILKAYLEAYPGNDQIIYSWSTGLGGGRLNPITGQAINAQKVNDEQIFDGPEVDASIPDTLPPAPAGLYQAMNKITKNALFIAFDYADIGRQLAEQRCIRDIQERNTKEHSDVYTPIVIISTVRTIPDMLKKLFISFDLDLLKEPEVEKAVMAFGKCNGCNFTDDERATIARAATGLTVNEMSRIFKFSYEKTGKLDPKIISNEKIQAIKKSSILTYIEPKKTLDSVGGHDLLKTWIREVKACMTPAAETFGVKPIKGCIFQGIAGTGKTAVAEAIANYLGIPLIIFDLSRIMGGLVGESETTARRAFETIKSIGHSVILLDECDKQLGGVSSGGGTSQADAGTMGRVFGVVLQNLQENNGQFYILTANDISRLPGPLTRSGRLDTKWFFDFPSKTDRKDIFNIYFKTAHKQISNALLDYAVSITNNYTGAEIEVAVNNTIRIAFLNKALDNKSDDITKDALMQGIREVSTVYATNRSEVESLKNYASQNKIRSTSSASSMNQKHDITANNGNNTVGSNNVSFIAEYMKQYPEENTNRGVSK